MRSVLRGCEAPAIPNFFMRELRTIAPEFYPKWHQSGRWLIVKNCSKEISKRGYIVEFAVHNGRGGYAPLDMKVIDILKELKQERDRLDNPDKFLVKMDQEEDEKMQKALKLKSEMRSEFEKKVHKFLTSKTFS